MSADSVMQFARTLIGSHYLWGAAGATPQGQDGASYRPNSVYLAQSSLDPSSPCIFAAACDVQGHFVCAGAFKRFPGGRAATRYDSDLQNYLASLNDYDSSANWPCYYDVFTPRVVQGYNVAEKGTIVWGEDCRYRRHFDCIGFVNYVLSASTSRPWGYSIDQYANGITGAYAIDKDADLADADILIRGSEHIGLLGANGKVVQAEQASKGVHGDSPYDSSWWSTRLRIPDSCY